MKNRTEQNPSMLVETFDRLTGPGVLGSYQTVDVTTVIGIRKGEPTVNVLTVAVCEGVAPTPGSTDIEKIGKLQPLPGLKEWSFGMVRYRLALPEMRSALVRFQNEGVWIASGSPLSIGQLSAQSPMFVPPHNFERVSLNALLKNNFYGGSYVVELADPSKEQLLFLLSTPARFDALGKMIAERGGPAVDAVSDRVGNILLQFPVESVALRWRAGAGGIEAELDWRPGVAARPARITCSIEADGVFTGYASVQATEGPVALDVGSLRHEHRLTVMDEENGLLLAVTPKINFIHQTSATMSMPAGKRRFRSGNEIAEVPILTHHPSVSAGKLPAAPNGPWEGRRLYQDGRAELERHREFWTYGGRGGSSVDDERDAIENLRWLIRRHGREAVWLWDPYLSADDVMRTLCWNPHGNAKMRAVTEGLRPMSCGVPASEDGQTAVESWIKSQRACFENDLLELADLKLEFRISRGQKGWKFHDRFLIFPRAEPTALAWSLGTSVNHAGAAHHILHKVPDGQRIADDFERLWDALTDLDHRIWQCPKIL